MTNQQLTSLPSISNNDIDNNMLFYVVDVTGGNIDSQLTKNNLFAGTKITQLTLTIPTSPTGSSSTEFVSAIKVSSGTVTFATAQSADYVTNEINQVTLVNPSAGTITNATSLKIAGPPIASTNVTITNAYSLWVVSGNTILQTVTLQGALTMSANISLGSNSFTTTTFTLNEVSSTGIFGSPQWKIVPASGNNLTLLLFAPSGTTTFAGWAIGRVSDVTTNYEAMIFASDDQITGEYATNIIKGGTGSLRPWNIYMNGVKQMSFNVAGSITTYVQTTIQSQTTYLYYADSNAGNSQPAQLYLQKQNASSTIVNAGGIGAYLTSTVAGSEYGGLELILPQNGTLVFGLQLDINNGFYIPNFPLKLQETITLYDNIATAGIGVFATYAAAIQTSITGAAAGTLLSYTPPATKGTYKIRFTWNIKTVNTGTGLGWTITYHDANGTAVAPTNLALTQAGTAAPALTYSANGNYYSEIEIDIDNSATAIVVKLTGTGSITTSIATATITQVG